MFGTCSEGEGFERLTSPRSKDAEKAFSAKAALDRFYPEDGRSRSFPLFLLCLNIPFIQPIVACLISARPYKSDTFVIIDGFFYYYDSITKRREFETWLAYLCF